MAKYSGFIPPCGVYCGNCPKYLNGKKPCLGAEHHCRVRRCKGIYVCCIEKKGHDFCYECKSFPCSRFKKFSESWMEHGQDLILNQKQLKEQGKEKWLECWNR